MAAPMLHFLFICACLVIGHVTAQAQQQQLLVNFDLQEESGNNTLIGSLVTQLNLASKVNESISNLVFHFLTIDDPAKALFRIEQETSKIFTRQNIDRENEKVCRYSTECLFEFSVAASSSASNYFQIINVKINITDINDNPPYFENNFLQINISEATTVNKSILTTDGASDLDRGKNNSVQSHEFLSHGGDFRLQIARPPFDNLKLNIITNVSLDRESKDVYTLHVLARDGGNPVRTGTLLIRVNVLDENDNTPKFVIDYANVTVNETETANKTVFKFTAIDKDAGLNGKVVYKFKKFLSNEGDFRRLFRINNITGEVSVIDKLEYTPDTVYSVIIEASDMGSNPRSSTARLDVTVKDVGNNQPKVTLTFFKPSASENVVNVPEDSPLGLVIAHITVVDTDSGKNGEVTCRTFSTYFGLQSIADKGYTVIIQHKLDREAADTHNISVTCSDKGKPVLDDTVKFTVKVLDTNDNPPKFSEYFYNVNIHENNNIGQTVIKVNATDPDEGANAEISYAIEPVTDTRFSIDRNTGVVTSNINFDREQTLRVTFQVRAMDHGNPPKNNTVTVYVTINDTNDNSPTFLNSNYVFSISENLSAGVHVGSEHLFAKDEDQNKNGEVVYSLPKSFNASSIPFIVLSTGEIKTNRPLDREKQSRYDFPVIATDRGTPSRTGSANVTVLVQDQNDNVPIFIFPNNENSTVHIPNTTPVETIITSVQAYDVDDDSQGNGNGRVMYFITDGNKDGIFYLHHETGSLFYRKAVVFKDKTSKEFPLRVTAKDNGSPELEASQTLTVVVHYSNATTAASRTASDTGDNRYVLIVVSVICATFVCSVGLIACIIVLRKRGDGKTKTSGLYPARIPPPMYDAAPPLGGNKGYTVPGQNGKASKSKVTFAQNSKFTKEQLMEKLTGSPNGHIAGPSTDTVEGTQNGLHRAPLQPLVHNGKYIDQHQTKLNPEDSPSETSGETIGTDSGHGGSEEDFANNNDHRFVPEQRFKKSDIFMIHPNSRNNGINMPIKSHNEPPHYASLHHNRSQKNSKYMDDSLLTSSLNSVSSYRNNSVSRQNSASAAIPPSLPTIPAFPSLHRDGRLSVNDSLIFYKDGTLGSQSAHSRDDDDCRSTTTSGSYTINHEELDDDINRMRPRDLFV